MDDSHFRSATVWPTNLNHLPSAVEFSSNRFPDLQTPVGWVFGFQGGQTISTENDDGDDEVLTK